MNKVISIEEKIKSTYETFPAHLEIIDQSGGRSEGDEVGVALLKKGSESFWLKLWGLSERFYVSPVTSNRTAYDVLTCEEYTTKTGEKRAEWHKVGSAQVVGVSIRLSIFIFPMTVLISLYPKQNQNVSRGEVAS